MFAIPLVTLVLLQWTSLADSSCPDGWLHHVNTCYHFSHDAESMAIASLICKHMGGTLSEIESSAENIYVTSQAKLQRLNFWIGLNDIQEEGIWMWYESKRSLNATGFSDWAPRQPDNHHGEENCAYLSGSGHWADGPCHNTFHYLCEKPDEVVDIVG